MYSVNYWLLPLAVFNVTMTAAHAASELDHITVTATRSGETLADTSSSVTAITRQEIDARNYRSVSDALRGVPGVDVVQSGSWGAQTSVFMRGANSNHTLIMIDGHEISDPSTPTGAFDFAHLSIDSIERIEVVRGSHSSLHGSHAIGGLINIVTRKHATELDISGSAGYGTGDLVNSSASIAIPYNNLSIIGNVSYLESNNQSLTSRRLSNNPEDDRYQRLNGSINLNYAVQSTELNFYAGILDHEEELDLAIEDPNSRSEGTRETYKLDVDHAFTDFWDASLMLAHTRHDRRIDNPANPGDLFPTIQDNNFEGERDEADLYTTLRWLGQATTAGVFYKEESLETDSISNFGGFILADNTDADSNTRGFYINQAINLLDRINADIGMRLDDHSGFGSHDTYHARLSYQVTDNLNLRGGYSTGFRAPSLFELYGFTPNNFGSAYRGNPNLEPEESDSYEFGFDANIGSVAFGSTYFHLEVDNLVQLVFLPTFDSTSMNIKDEIESRGFESYINIRLDQVTIGGSHTHTDTDDGQGEALLRRPENKASAFITYAPGRLSTTLSLDFVGSRDDIDRATFATVEMPGYTVWNASADFKATEHISFFGKIWNLTNKDYEPVNGFQGLERQLLVGVKITN